MKNGQGIRAIIFDMDDTLIDWRSFSGNWRDIERQYVGRVLAFVEQCNAPIQGSDDDFIRTYGENVQNAWLQARSTLRAPHMGRVLMQTLADFGVKASEAVTMRTCLQAVEWRGIDSVTCFPDVPDALQELQDAGYALGILTNAFHPMWLRDVELERYHLLRYFPDEKTRMSAADIGHLKPHPQVFRYALEQMGTSAEQTVYVGDNPVADIAGAQRVGLRAVLRVNTPTPPLISGLIEPDASVTTLADLPPLLEQWNQPGA